MTRYSPLLHWLVALGMIVATVAILSPIFHIEWW